MNYPKFNKLNFIFYLLSGIFIACGQSNYQKTASGVEYQLFKRYSLKSWFQFKKKPKNNDVLLLSLMYTTKKGAVIFNSAQEKKPIELHYHDSIFQNKAGHILELIHILQRGDSIVASMEAEKVLENFFDMIAPNFSLEKKTPIFVHICLKNIMSKKEHQKWKNKQIKIHMKTQQQLMLNQEQTIIQYLESNNINATKTNTGLWYYIEKSGEGVYPKTGSKVQVHYTGKILQGKVFDTSYEEIAKKHNLYNQNYPYKPIDFTLGIGQVIQGWDEGIALLKKGTKAKFFIPSQLAYGSRGAGNAIPPNSILEFDVELVNITEPIDKK